MKQVRTTEPITGYYLDRYGLHVESTVPAGSIGELGIQGEDGAAAVIVVHEGRDVILPNLSPGQHEDA